MPRPGIGLGLGMGMGMNLSMASLEANMPAMESDLAAPDESEFTNNAPLQMLRSLLLDQKYIIMQRLILRS